MACLPVELAQTEVAVSEERAHAEFHGQSLGAGIVDFGRRHVRAASGCRLAEKAVDPSFVTPLTTLAGKHQGTGAKVPRLLQPTREQVRLAELRHAHRAQISDPGGCI